MAWIIAQTQSRLINIQAQQLREGLFSISWTVQNVSRNIPNSQVVVNNLQNYFQSCSLTFRLEQNYSVIVLEMKTTNLPETLLRHLKAVVMASYGSVKQEMTLNESIWKTLWPWNPNEVVTQPSAITFEILIDFNPDDGATFEEKSTRKSTKNVLDHLAKLWENKTLSDVTFKCGDKLIKAHTLILASGSPVLAAMFQNDCREKQDRIVFIKDIKSNILENLFRYMYVGECTLLENEEGNAEEVADLLVAADKYTVDSVKEECELHLSKILSVENAAKFLVLAHLHNCAKLHETALDFMAKNAKAVCSRKDWMEIIKNYPELCFQATQLMVGL